MLTNYEAKILLDSELQYISDKRSNQKKLPGIGSLLYNFKGMLVDSKRPNKDVLEYLKGLGLDKMEILQILNNFEKLNSAMIYLMIEDCEERLGLAEQGLDVEKFLVKLKSIKS